MNCKEGCENLAYSETVVGRFEYGEPAGEFRAYRCPSCGHEEYIMSKKLSWHPHCLKRNEICPLLLYQVNSTSRMVWVAAYDSDEARGMAIDAGLPDDLLICRVVSDKYQREWSRPGLVDLFLEADGPGLVWRVEE